MDMLVLVTGAGGFIGSHLVRRLVSIGLHVRAAVRSNSKMAAWLDGTPSCQTIVGDIRDERFVRDATAGVHAVVHLAAATSGSWGDHESTTVEGTRALLEIAEQNGVPRFLHVSSMSVYDFSRTCRGCTVDESAPLEQRPEMRDKYARAKLLADLIAQRYLNSRRMQVVILRPGVVIGPGGRPPLLSTILRPLPSVHLAVGGGRRMLPLVYVQNLIDAIFTLLNHACTGIYNVVDEEPLTEAEFHSKVLLLMGRRRLLVPVPVLPFLVVARFVDFARKVGIRNSDLSLAHAVRRVTADVRFEASALRRETGWRSRVRVADALETTFRTSPASLTVP